MTQGAQSLHLLGSKVSSNNTMALDVNATNAIQHMKQEMIRLQSENEKLTAQLNCFISLVQRSWKGDKFATTHLSNIVGIDPPTQKSSSKPNDGTQARPNSQVDSKSRSQINWERLAKKLIDREYQAVQEEIQEYQQKYIQNRQLYMDAVLYDHHQSMSSIAMRRNSSNSNSNNMEDVDSRFIKHSKAIQRMGASHRQNRRAQSAKVRRKPSAQEQVKGMDIKLRDLVGETPSSSHFTAAEASNEPYTITPSQNLKQRPQTAVVKRFYPNTYNDPSRYAQGNLYDLQDSEVARKTRPVSASSLREADAVRSRPRTGSAGKIQKIGTCTPTFMTQKNERALKYEATKPVYNQHKHAKPRIKSAGHIPSPGLMRSNSHTGLMAQTDVISASSAHVVSPPFSVANGHSPYHDPTSTKRQQNGSMPNVEESSVGYAFDREMNHDDMALPEDVAGLPPKPAISVRVKSAFTRRPEHIDKFAEEERKMRLLEEDFRKTALGLQKKLGIEDQGVVIFE